MRDAERFYQDKYNQYKAEKDFRLRSWETDSVDRFAHLRAVPLHRQTSVQPYSSRLVDASSVTGRAASVTKDASESATTFKSELKPVPAYDPQRETASLEERLERLRKLREDLGLPADTETSKNTLRDSVSRTVNNDVESSYKSERSTRLGTRSRATAATSDDSSYSYKSERKSRLNGIGGSSASEDYKYKYESSNDSSKLTPRLERKAADVTPKFERKSYSSKTDSLNDDLSFSKTEKKAERYSKLSATAASSSSPVRSRKAAAAASTVESLDFDDDDFDVEKMMKKLPSSQEILDRISKMELDD